MTRHRAKKVGAKAWSGCAKKTRYRTEGEAQHFANRAMQHRPYPPLRVYDCSICNGWHMTGKPLGDNS